MKQCQVDRQVWKELAENRKGLVVRFCIDKIVTSIRAKMDVWHIYTSERNEKYERTEWVVIDLTF